MADVAEGQGQGQPAAAPSEAAQTQQQIQQPADGQQFSFTDRLRQEAAQRRQGRQGREAGQQRQAGATKAVTATADPDPQGEAPEPAEQAKTEEVDIDRLRNAVARSTNAAKQWERKARELEQRHKQLEEELGKERSAWEQDPIKAAEAKGLTLRQWLERSMGKKESQQLEQRAEDGEPAAVRELKERLERLETEKQQAEQTNLRQQELGVIDQQAKGNDKWSIIHRLGRQEEVYQHFYSTYERQGFAPRLEDVMDEVADHLRGGAKALVSADAVLDVVKGDPELREKLLKALADEQTEATEGQVDRQPAQQAQRAKGRGAPAVNPNRAGDVQSIREKKLTQSDRRMRAKELLNRRLGAQ